MVMFRSIVQSNSDPACPKEGDYSPCFCSLISGTSNDSMISCNSVSMEDVYAAFSSNEPAELTQVSLALLSGEKHIPANILADHRIQNLIIVCYPGSTNKVIIDREAFSSTIDIIQYVFMLNCNFDQMDFTFLNGSENLSSMALMLITNIHLANWASSMPPLPALTEIFISYCSELNAWDNFPELVNGLINLIVYSNGANLSDEGLDRILQWVLNSSADTLLRLDVHDNALTYVPQQIRAESFRNLKHLVMYDQKGSGIKTFPSGSINFISHDVETLDFHSCGIETIESGAFQGIHSIFIY